MKKKTIIRTNTSDIMKYMRVQKDPFRSISNLLVIEINDALPQSTSKIYYSFPVWFIKENPIVGFKVTKNDVNLLFWSGKSFGEPDLIPVGKYKAAQIKYWNIKEMKKIDIRRWLKKSKSIIWDYKNIRDNEGRLLRIKSKKSD